jgi:cytochrome c-type biogenesis protein CcmH
MADNPVVEARLIAISEELRCLVCQNESLAGSRAELAEDLRREVRKLIQDGKSDTEIKDYLVARYGDFVLYRPPVKPTTWLLWFGPFALLAGAVAGLIAYLRRAPPGSSRRISPPPTRPPPKPFSPIRPRPKDPA